VQAVWACTRTHTLTHTHVHTCTCAGAVRAYDEMAESATSGWDQELERVMQTEKEKMPGNVSASLLCVYKCTCECASASLLCVCLCKCTCECARVGVYGHVCMYARVHAWQRECISAVCVCVCVCVCLCVRFITGACTRSLAELPQTTAAAQACFICTVG
jgi:hypothetical protein